MVLKVSGLQEGSGRFKGTGRDASEPSCFGRWHQEQSLSFYQRIPAGSVFFSASSLLKNLAGWCTDSGAYESMVFAAMCLQVLWQPFAV